MMLNLLVMVTNKFVTSLVTHDLDSSGASDSGSEDDAGGDPFAPFMTQTFSGFNFSAPTFFQPQYNTTPSVCDSAVRFGLGLILV